MGIEKTNFVFKVRVCNGCEKEVAQGLRVETPTTKAIKYLHPETSTQ